MKKLTKLKLEDLANQMKTVERNEIESVVGGDWFYIEQDDRIQQYGSGDTFRVVNNSWEIYQGGNAPRLNEVSDSRQISALKALGRQAGMGNDVIITTADYSSSSGVSFAVTQWLPGGGTIVTVNNDTNLYENGNYYNLLLIMKHEAIHTQQPNHASLTEYERNMAELQAYTAMVNDPMFYYCTPSFQDTIRDSLEEYRLRTGHYYY